ncbi:MAG: FlgO family outer membrane protein [Elusimicrobiota bacterium]|jgi:TolB-like protein
MKLLTLKRLLLAAALGTLFVPPAQASNGFKSMAKTFVRAADGRVQRVAVLPFEPADGGSSAEGWNISEKLLTQLVRQGKIQAVERSLLRKLMGEHYLGRLGVLNPATLKRIGQVFAVDAVVTGSFVAMGSEAVINARFIDVETGVILAAEECRVAREWFEQGAPSSSSDPFWAVPIPAFPVEPPPILESGPAELRDAVSQTDCTDAAERVDVLERQVLDLKARFWALQLRKGADLSKLTHNPGSTITDPLLKQLFYQRMKEWYARESIPELAPHEVRRFVASDRAAFSLHRECGL